MGTTRQDTSELLEIVSRYHWYQSIELAPGVVTPGETGDASLRKLDMMQLPKDLSGKSVLDIGCNEGFFAFEAERRGASPVVAVDKGEDAQTKFGVVKEILHSKVELQAWDLYDMKPARVGRYDIVFFLAVLHHVRYPLLAIDRIYKLTRETAYLEFVEAVPEDGRDVSALVRRLSKKGHLHWLPTRTLTLELLDRAGFKRVDVLGTHRAKGAGTHRGMPGFSMRRVLLAARR